MLITPTPRAMSPQDIVRIYVPPAPPDEQQQPLKSPQSPQSNGTITKTTTSTTISTTKMNGSSPPSKSLSASTISLNSSKTNTVVLMRNGTATGANSSSDGLNRNSYRNSLVSAEPGGSGDVTPVRRSMYRSDEELRFAGIVTSSTSSSRRGSLSRKIPAPAMLLENKLMMECQHLQATRRGSATSIGSSSNNRVQLNISLENISSPHKSNTALDHQQQRRVVMMTSFEELAKDAAFNLIRSKAAAISRDNSFTPDDDNFSLLSSLKSGGGSSRYVASTIEYKAFSPTDQQRRPRQRQPSDPISSPTDYYDVTLASSPEKLNKTIEFGGGRFFYSQSGNNISSERKKSSDDSSSTTTTSPNANKSIVNTPVTETVPLLMASPTSPPSSSATYRQFGADDDDDDEEDGDDDNSISSPTTTTSSKGKSHRRIKHVKSEMKITPRPSKIPLFHHKALSPTSSSDSSSVLAPVEIPPAGTTTYYHNKNISNHRRIGSGGSAAQDFDSRIAAPLGGAYEFNNRSHHRSTTTTSSNGGAGTIQQPSAGIARSQDLNKIRIKINQNQRN